MKAVLVVDIPNGYGDIADNKAIVTLRNSKLGTSLGIYNVPLKPLPKAKTREEEIAKDPFNEDLFYGDYIRGWNECLDEITGAEDVLHK